MVWWCGDSGGVVGFYRLWYHTNQVVLFYFAGWGVAMLTKLIRIFYLIYPNMYRLGSKDPNTFFTEEVVLGIKIFAHIRIVTKIQFHVSIICLILQLLLGSDKYFKSNTVILIWLDFLDFPRVMLLNPSLCPAARICALFALKCRGGVLLSRPSVDGFWKFQSRSSRMGHRWKDQVGPREDQQSFGHKSIIWSQNI